jgi:hypothetical protein
VTPLVPCEISTGCPELDLAWREYANEVVSSHIPIPDTDADLTWHAFLGHGADMAGFRAAEFVGVDPLPTDRHEPRFEPLNRRGIGVPELASLWRDSMIRQHLMGLDKDEPLGAVTLKLLRATGGDVGASLADAFDSFPRRRFNWSLRALAQNSAALERHVWSFRCWLQAECRNLGMSDFPPPSFRRAVTLAGERLPLEEALRHRLKASFFMVGWRIAGYMISDWQLWLWREGRTSVFASFKLDLFHEKFVGRFGRGIVPADEVGFARWWHGMYPELPPRLANECIWLAIERKLVNPW